MNIMILGAGIAGLSSALFLKRAGFDVTVYERESSINTMGAGIVCWPNATFVLKQLDLESQLIKYGNPVKEMTRLTSDNECLGSINISTINETLNDISYSILRKDLVNSLYQTALDASVTFKFNHQVENIQTENNKAMVRFSNDQYKTADIILGADGRMHSQARLYVSGNNQPKYQGFSNWVGICESEDLLFDEKTIQDFWGVGSRFGLVPISNKTCYWAMGLKENTQTNKDMNQQQLLKLSENFPDKIKQIIKNTNQKTIKKIFVHDHDTIKLWHKNNLLLIGDSAHAPLPTSGQGACQALVDAWLFSTLIKESTLNKVGNNKVGAVFETFTQRRIVQTHSIMQSGRFLASSIFNDDQNYCKQRNAQAKQSDYNQMAQAMSQAWKI
ncbi:FAD-dependent oxidoreductase [Marinicellulosiphila megalodicopiae]|uniref:FAD-dependent oxidoreductase n=1 Tax=Marinicellulosiphila megalodicopiae TaxID=2724896 RepID=UPI003BB1FC07